MAIEHNMKLKQLCRVHYQRRSWVTNSLVSRNVSNIFKVTIQLQKKRIDAVGVKCIKGDAGDLASTTAD